MGRKGINAKGRRESGAFVAMPCAVLDHPNFTRLTPKGIKLFVDLCAQLRMKQGGPNNNGDLSIAWTLMEKRGWSSKQTLYEAKEELEHYGWIMLTRQGGRHTPSLFALTFFAINECEGKLDVAETRAAPGHWKQEKPKWIPSRKLKTVVRPSGQCGTTIVPVQPKTRVIQ